VSILKKFITTILATSAAAVGLFFAGAAGANASTTYTVKSGDSVWAISQQFGSSINAIEGANSISNHLIMPGQKLVIPDGTSTTAATTNTTSAATQSTTNTQQKASYSQPAANTTANTTSASSNASYGSSTKSAVLSQMASRTGVSAATWDAIISRESNWQPSVRNSSSGAYGLFQNMHINGGSVQQQVDAAVSLYNQQGMSAWSLG
jgi:murein DD-endopeptidase MepM/ murein hydrolase activator NlpD